MKIQFCSDLHLEMRNNYLLEHTDSDVIVLAGDISTGLRGVDFAGALSISHNKEVIIIAGNHEYYRHDYFDLLSQMRIEVEKYPRCHFLECDELILGDIRFLGATLWTDYRGNGKISTDIAMAQIEQSLTDHYVIKINDRLFRPADALAIHRKTIRWLKEKLDTPFKGKTVVVSHHSPSLKCDHPFFPYNTITPAFLSDLDHLVKKADLWIYGHSHASGDVMVGSCRLVSNQVGYPQERLPIAFKPNWVLEL